MRDLWKGVSIQLEYNNILKYLKKVLLKSDTYINIVLVTVYIHHCSKFTIWANFKTKTNIFIFIYYLKWFFYFYCYYVEEKEK